MNRTDGDKLLALARVADSLLEQAVCQMITGSATKRAEALANARAARRIRQALGESFYSTPTWFQVLFDGHGATGKEWSFVRVGYGRATFRHPDGREADPHAPYLDQDDEELASLALNVRWRGPTLRAALEAVDDLYAVMQFERLQAWRREQERVPIA